MTMLQRKKANQQKAIDKTVSPPPKRSRLPFWEAMPYFPKNWQEKRSQLFVGLVFHDLNSIVTGYITKVHHFAHMTRMG